MSQWQSTPYTFPTLLAAVLASGLAVYLYLHSREYETTESRWFAVVAAGAAIWCGGYAVQLTSATLAGKLFWYNFFWIGSTIVVFGWLPFAIQYTGHDHWITRSRLLAFGGVALLGLGLLFTNQFHKWFIAEYELDRMGDFVVLMQTNGVAAWLYLTYLFSASLFATVLIFKSYFEAEGPYRKQIFTVAAVGISVFLASLVQVLGLSPLPAGFDPTPIVFGFAVILLSISLYRHRLFGVGPLARQALFAEMREGIVVLDPAHTVVDANAAAEPVLEVAHDDAVEEHAADVLTPYDTLFEDEPNGNFEQILTVGEGTERRIYDARVSMLDEQFERNGLLLVLRDVTERRDLESRFRTLIETSTSLISILGPNGTRRYTSPSVRSILGYEPETFDGADLLEHVHPDDHEAVRRAFTKILETGSARFEHQIRHADGSWRTVETVGDNLLDDPSVAGIVLTSHDVTERTRYEQRLRVLNRVLRHDLRNDVNVIMGYATLLMEQADDTETRQRAQTIHETAAELANLGNKARQVDNTIHGAVDGQHRLEVIEPIERRLEDAQQDNYNVVVETNMPEEAWVYADGLIETAIDNVIDNAIEHNDTAEPTVMVSCELSTSDGIEYVDVTVADNGPGIPEAERTVLVEGVETQLNHVSGLGLWLVQWLVDRSGGEVYLEENEPRGSVVTIRLRRATAGYEPTQRLAN